MDAERLIQMLNQDLRMEHSLVLRYMTLANGLDPSTQKELISEFQMLSRESISHSGMVAEMIHQLGGTPTTELTQYEHNTDLKRVLEASIQIEITARDNYRTACNEVEGHMHKALSMLANEEQTHIDILKNALNRLS